MIVGAGLAREGFVVTIGPSRARPAPTVSGYNGYHGVGSSHLALIYILAGFL